MSLTVLVADDDPLVRRQLVPLLTRMGLQVMQASDGDAAWECLVQNRPQMAILDWMMPGVNGLDLCRRIREEMSSRYTYVIMLTGVTERDGVKAAMAAGVDDFLPKPVDRNDLEMRLTVARRILDMQEALVGHQVRMQEDLKAASQVQRRLLPKAPPVVPGLTCAWHWQPCEELGGDTLGLLALADGRVGFHLLDVAGHGVRSALLAVQISRILHQESTVGQSSIQVLQRLNREFPFELSTLQYFTMLVGFLDPTTWEVTIGHAAHPGPFLITADGQVQDLSKPASPVGIYPEDTATFADSTLTLPPGGTLLLFSDGVTEAMNPDGQCFGNERLLAVLHHTPVGNVTIMIENIVKELSTWRGKAVVNDDISLLCLNRSFIY